MAKNSLKSPVFGVIVVLLSISSIVSSVGILRDIIRDGETLVSESGIFVLGFFDPNKNGSSTGITRYLGLWHNFSSYSIVWVANRENPVTHSFGALQLREDGDLIISQNQSIDSDRIVWSSNSSNSAVVNPTVKLLDSGNLIITSNNGTEDGGTIIWQSFDYPTDTLLPGMKLGFNKQSSFQRYLTAWKTPNDPSPGMYVARMDNINELHEVYTSLDKKKFIRYGSWNGFWFVGFPEMKVTYDYTFTFVDNQTEAFYRFNMTASDSYGRFTVFPNNTIYTMVKRKTTPTWLYYERNSDTCDRYAYCGPNSICNPLNAKSCECFTGFRPKSSLSWEQMEYSNRCERKEVLNCANNEGFLQLIDVKTPDTTNSTVDKKLSMNECKDLCVKNCSCTTYDPVYLETIAPRGCIMWYGDLIDTVLYNSDDGEQLYLRLPNSEILKNSSKNNKKIITIVSVVVVRMILISLFIVVIIIKKKKQKQRDYPELETMSSPYQDVRRWKDDIPLFDFLTISSSTNNFSSDNIVGKGGFGDVYKGTMKDGREIAIKRLSKNSRNGLDDFMNEVVLIAKLQHRNLLQMLGCCMERNERILVYEFMKNKSLDKFIFGENRYLLDWPKRVEIIIGIGRGILYLHQDSRLRIIHRDLKPSNVLLDNLMDPKISDFGTARLFVAEQLQENTGRIIGTIGYMSPEYANGGIFSIKSDVFSFGVLLLEIISGKKSRIYYEPDVYLLEMIWTLYKEGKSLIVLDEYLSNSCSIPQVLRFIQIGLLCVQEKAIDRPTMSDVLFMLGNENSQLKEAKRPAFCSDSSGVGHSHLWFTNNTMSLTMLDGR